MSLPLHLEILRDEALTTSCEAWAIRSRWTLSAGVDRAGPCPVCGGKDRFAIHRIKNTFNCRCCGLAGSGVIELVMKVQGVGFTRSCEIITGRAADAPIDERQAAQLRAKAEADEQRRRAESERYRENARKKGYELWRRARAIDWAGSRIVERYLSKRGIGAEQALRAFDVKSLRVIERMRFMEKQGSGWECLAEVPAMIAAIQLPDGRFGGAHITWLDFNTDKGRLILPVDAAGKARPTKKVRGTQKSGAIRLYTPENATRIVMGEGIESTLSVMVHGFEPNTAYWAGVNLGNMAGRAARDDAGKIIHDQPDMGDHDSFVPPSWCKSLIYLADGDSEESRITEKLTRGLRRAMRTHEGLVGKLVPAPAQGADMNDLAMQMARAGDV